jgi:hypothetical protein
MQSKMTNFSMHAVLAQALGATSKPYFIRIEKAV